MNSDVLPAGGRDLDDSEINTLNARLPGFSILKHADEYAQGGCLIRLSPLWRYLLIIDAWVGGKEVFLEIRPHQVLASCLRTTGWICQMLIGDHCEPHILFAKERSVLSTSSWRKLETRSSTGA